MKKCNVQRVETVCTGEYFDECQPLVPSADYQQELMELIVEACFTDGNVPPGTHQSQIESIAAPEREKQRLIAMERVKQHPWPCALDESKEDG